MNTLVWVMCFILGFGQTISTFEETNGFPQEDEAFSSAWELALKTLDECVHFSNVDTRADDIHFYLNGKEIQAEDEIDPLEFSNESVQVYIHGYQSNISIFDRILDAYTDRNITTIMVDWEIPASQSYSMPYCDPAIQTYRVGYNLAELLKYLHDEGFIQSAKVHIIGHGLGAHVAGWTGKQFIIYSAGKLGRITGLDPSYPGFRLKPSTQRLARDDATTVDIIHTNGKVKEEYQTTQNAFLLGFPESIGHYDFFPNGGFQQPGCPEGFEIACNHEFSLNVFVSATLRSLQGIKSFKSQKCSSYDSFMGRGQSPCTEQRFNYMANELQITEPQGNYFLCTDPKDPFDKGETAGLQCKPVFKGFHLRLLNLAYDEDISPNDKEFVGIEEINNNSPATVRQLVKLYKKTWESYEMTLKISSGLVVGICANLKVFSFAPQACFSYSNPQNGMYSVRSEMESEFSLEREVIVPPNSNIHVCSTVSTSKNTEMGFRATGQYTAEGFIAEEVAELLRDNDINGIIDKPNEAVLVDMSGQMKVSITHEPQFIVSDVSIDGQSSCVQTFKLLKEVKNGTMSIEALDNFLLGK